MSANDGKTLRARKLVLNRETLRELDPESLEQVAGGISLTGIGGMVNDAVEAVTIVASSPCSNVYSRCNVCVV